LTVTIQKKKRPALASLALVYAVFFTFLEMLKAYRHAQWSGTTLFDVSGILGAGALYFSIVLSVTFVLSWGVSRVLGKPDAQSLFALLIAFLAGAAIWGFLSTFREYEDTKDHVFVLGCMGAFTALTLVARVKRYSLRYCCSQAAVALLAGMAALIACGYGFLFDPQRATLVTILPVMWCTVAALTGYTAWSYRWPWKIMYAACAIGLPLALGFGLTWSPLRSGENEQPNFVFIVSDTLRADYLGVYGGPVPTPNLDQLAIDGTVFERSYSLAPWTLPSMTAMFQSQYPPGLTPGADDGTWMLQLWQYGFDPNKDALAAQLKEQGYATAAITSNAFLPVLPTMMSGFETRANAHPILLVREGYFNHTPFLLAALEGLFPSQVSVRPQKTMEDMTRYARAYLRRNRNRPFYLWVHYIDPHAPYDAPEAYRSIKEGPWPFFHPYVGGERWGIPILGKNFEVLPEHRAYTQSLYEGECQWVDEHVGKLMDTLEGAGLSGNTYVCFTSDHGEELWDHEAWGHGQSMYEELLRVPLIMSGPGVARQQRIVEPVSAIDLIPTFADLLHVDSPPTWRGKSLGPVLRGETRPTGPVFAQGTSNKAAPHPRQMVVLEQYKLIRGQGDDENSLTLFDLKKDPGEEHNIAAEYPEKVRELHKLLQDWRDSFNSTFEVDSVPEDREFDRTVQEQIQNMGYF
jgi:arylsulfatase A-like enzyme